MESDSAPLEIRVEVAYATPDKQVLLEVTVPAGCTVSEAISLSGIRDAFPGLDPDLKDVGIFSQKVSPDRELRDGDRVEIYRPLLIDPKERRKQRAQEKS